MKTAQHAASRAFICIAIAAMSAGCSTSMKEAHLSKTGSLGAESMAVLCRPLEFGVETIGDATGEAYYKKFLWFTLEGDRPDISIPTPGLTINDSLEKLACYRAAKSKNGDAFYKITSEKDGISILWCIYRERHITVTGKALKLKDLGPLDEKRSDELRKHPPLH